MVLGTLAERDWHVCTTGGWLCGRVLAPEGTGAWVIVDGPVLKLMCKLGFSGFEATGIKCGVASGEDCMGVTCVDVCPFPCSGAAMPIKLPCLSI